MSNEVIYYVSLVIRNNIKKVYLIDCDVWDSSVSSILTSDMLLSYENVQNSVIDDMEEILYEKEPMFIYNDGEDDIVGPHLDVSKFVSIRDVMSIITPLTLTNTFSINYSFTRSVYERTDTKFIPRLKLRKKLYFAFDYDIENLDKTYITVCDKEFWKENKFVSDEISFTSEEKKLAEEIDVLKSPLELIYSFISKNNFIRTDDNFRYEYIGDMNDSELKTNLILQGIEFNDELQQYLRL